MFTAWSHTEIWALIAMTLWLLEVFVPGMILGCLGTGALGGVVAAALGGSIEVQLIAAAATSIAAFLFLRPLALKHWFKGSEITTGTEALAGRTAQVTAPFDEASLMGRCKVDGDDWLAQWEATGTPPPALGSVVRVLRAESNILIVTEI